MIDRKKENVNFEYENRLKIQCKRKKKLFLSRVKRTKKRLRRLFQCTLDFFTFRAAKFIAQLSQPPSNDQNHE